LRKFTVRNDIAPAREAPGWRDEPAVGGPGVRLAGLMADAHPPGRAPPPERGPALRRLEPRDRSLSARAALAGLDLREQAPEDRPYVVANMVSSLDGRASIAGATSALGDEADAALFAALRERVDAILAGTATLRADRYRALARSPESRARRRAAGLAERPLAVVISRSGSVPLDIGLFQDPGSEVVLYTGARGLGGPVPAGVDVVRLGPGRQSPAEALADLRRRRGVRLLLCEGGPTLLGALVAEGLVDELFVTIAPTIVGGVEPQILGRAAVRGPRPAELIWALEHRGSLMLRYRLDAWPESPISD